jgi:hypothetical protein
MTLNSNWQTPAGRKARLAEKRHRYQRREKRRWNLLATMHGLPARGWEAAHEFVNWADEEWMEVASNYDYLGDPDAPRPMHDERWVAFTAGGAAAFLHGFDLPPAHEAVFFAGSLYVNNRKVPPADIRRAHFKVTALLNNLPDELATYYRVGMERAAWRLEWRREREGCEAPPLVETTGDEPEPPSFFDLVDVAMAHAELSIH